VAARYAFSLGVRVVPVALHCYNPWPFVYYSPTAPAVLNIR
jgi:hypothetical protein